jgi:hypothetical protein
MSFQLLLEFHPEMCKRLLLLKYPNGVSLLLTLMALFSPRLLGCRVGIEYFGCLQKATNSPIWPGLHQIIPAMCATSPHNPGNQEFGRSAQRGAQLCIV